MIIQTVFHFLKYLLLATLLTTVFLTIYATDRQIYRQSANDPQIQIAEDFKDAVLNGISPTALIPPYAADLRKTLSSFVVFYDDNGNPTASSAMLDGQTPKLPLGIFDFTKQFGEDRITWQPIKDIRIALVVKRIPGNEKTQAGFVAVGRSLREVEKRLDELIFMIVAAWAFSMFLIGAFAVAHYSAKKRGWVA